MTIVITRGTTIQSRRDEFWRDVNDALMVRGLEHANNGEIEKFFHLTTCPRQASELIERDRPVCRFCGTPTNMKEDDVPTCLDCFGRKLP